MADNQKEKKSSSVLGTRLRIMRDNADMSQSAVAKEIGLNTMSILNYETSKRVPDAEALRKFAQLYGCTADYLLGLADDVNAEEEAKSEKIADDFYSELEKLPHNTKIFLMEDLSRFIASTMAYILDDSDHHELIRAFCYLVSTHMSLADLLRNLREHFDNPASSESMANVGIGDVMSHLKETHNANEMLTTELMRYVDRYKTS